MNFGNKLIEERGVYNDKRKSNRNKNRPPRMIPPSDFMNPPNGFPPSGFYPPNNFSLPPEMNMPMIGSQFPPMMGSQPPPMMGSQPPPPMMSSQPPPMLSSQPSRMGSSPPHSGGSQPDNQMRRGPPRKMMSENRVKATPYIPPIPNSGMVPPPGILLPSRAPPEGTKVSQNPG